MTGSDEPQPVSVDQLDALISGNRLIFALGEAEARMDYHADGTLRVVLPGGKERHGTWTLGPGDAYTAIWSDADGPSHTCFHRDASGLIAKDAGTGEARGRILAIHPGQAGS